MKKEPFAKAGDPIVCLAFIDEYYDSGENSIWLYNFTTFKCQNLQLGDQSAGLEFSKPQDHAWSSPKQLRSGNTDWDGAFLDEWIE